MNAMNLIEERVNYKISGMGTVKKVNKPLQNPKIHVIFDDGDEGLFEYSDFIRGDITAVRDEVQQHILSVAEKSKNYMDKEKNAKGRRLRKATEKFKRDRLQPGENLKHFDRFSTIPLGLILLLPGLFFAMFSVAEIIRLKDGYGQPGVAVFIFAITALLLWCAFCYLTKINKNHYFVTDKRLGIREAFVFKKTRNIDIPIHEISSASYRSVTLRKGGSYVYLTVHKKDGESIVIKKSNLLLMEDAINKEISRFYKK
jgi:uncharacterized protein with PQ loop repeat